MPLVKTSYIPLATVLLQKRIKIEEHTDHGWMQNEIYEGYCKKYCKDVLVLQQEYNLIEDTGRSAITLN